MSTLHNTVMRLLAWGKAHALLLVAIAAALGLVVTIFATTFRLYDQRREQTVTMCEMANENRRALRGLVVALVTPSLNNPDTPEDRRELARRFRDEELAKLPPIECPKT